MRYFALLIIGLLLPFSSASAQGTWEHPRLERLATPDLERFEDERAYRNWVRDHRRARREITNSERASLDPEVYVAAIRVDRQDPCNPLYEDCPLEEGEEHDHIVVTGSRVGNNVQSVPVAVATVDAESITNNQSAGVDEGDIVKRIGDYLLVLQDGRIFVANFRTMQRTDRMDVYRVDENGDPIGADWYDEMLVQGDHIIITAYSYEDDASELSVFRLNRADGTLERRGVYLISSEDYYDTENYATRVIGDKLVVYTFFDPEDLVNRRDRPVVRRWVPSEEYDDEDRGRAILNARDIYSPVYGVLDPVVHTISMCDLGDLDEEGLTCESTAFIAGNEAEMFVSPDNIFLATTAAGWQDMSSYRVCRAERAGFQRAVGPAPGAVFRIPLRRPQEVDLLPVRGTVFNQFSMDQQGSRFRMLTSWESFECGENYYRNRTNQGDIELADISVAAFNTRYREADGSRFSVLPPVEDGYNFENRFVGEWLLYGTRNRSGRPPQAEYDESGADGFVVAVPLAHPDNAARVPLGHEVTRIEALGRNAIITGYRDESGLLVTHLDLAESATITDQAFLQGRYESEGRSHAFNAALYPEGDGLMGLPTVRAEGESGRRPWRSDNSGLSFLRFGADGDLGDLGMIATGASDPEEIDPDADEKELGSGSYSCEVSCVDWYGNSRPIFIERGIYGLMGTELVEAEVQAGQMVATRRLDLTVD